MWMVWTGENLFKRFLAEHRGHAGLTTSTSSVCVGPTVASCGCGAFFESWTHVDGQWTARIGNRSPRRSSSR
jgi:hypothetical protein